MLDGRARHGYSLRGMIAERDATLDPGGGVLLEARVAVPAGATTGLVACHPHPLYGGDMENPVVVRMVEVAAEAGLATCRFNFRGVGRSTGEHGGGQAEQDDVRAALGQLQATLGQGGRLVLAGYSFGASVSAAVAPTVPLAGLALIAPALAMTGEGPFAPLAGLGAPVLIAAGSRDSYCPLEALHALAARLPGAEARVIEGADHFFFGKLAPLGQALGAWLARLVAGEPGRRGGAA